MNTSIENEAAIWERVIHPEGKMSRATARDILNLDFSSDDKARMHELGVKNQSGSLTAEEEWELDNFARVGTMLGILKSRARRVLKSRRKT